MFKFPQRDEKLSELQIPSTTGEAKGGSMAKDDPNHHRREKGTSPLRSGISSDSIQPQDQEKEKSMAQRLLAPLPNSVTATSPISDQRFRAGMIRPDERPEPRTLVVGRGISVQGVIQDAERLVVEGTVEATTITATELVISQGGLFKGEVKVEQAEISGTIDGTLTALHSLIVRATGKMIGAAKYKRLQVEEGAQITAQIETALDVGAST